MTRRKKTRSIADRVTIRTGRRKDYKKWRHENPDQVVSSRRYLQKKRDQRKLQAARKLERQKDAPTLDVHGAASSDEGEGR
ncbi:hypothetical protein [Halotalea alkalilenta]|uniref:Uncharacterized protein n=1 Tax=Halotalea alkalilenta TaxID=376489 RepID=A0A172YFC5_9GAMM|nr:hypothetical protein [Halotalea alkalilenta]ANF57969.1 hypothetical protein A5892_11285 [Halotalea alkalilenta]